MAGLKRISVKGVVQGVGFRPFVYRLAHDHALAGWVLNHSGGVEIEVEGTLAALDAFVHDLSALAPPLARIVAVNVIDAMPQGYTGFEIRQSVSEEGRYQLISPDIATCADCHRELSDPEDRRHRYPFTNCTSCGPRFTIIRDIPYDRPLTTMQPFAMCPHCQREYDDPLDRRFHAQPNACPVCGPEVWMEESGAPEVRIAERDEALRCASRKLQEGEVLAVKGLGGFHLACDATNAQAVRRLRRRKGRPAKPLAVMLPTLDQIRRHCRVSSADEDLLNSPQCPIVLLPWREGSSVVPDVAPGNLYLGVMLPYTPLHHVLMSDVGRPLVMTSGNLSEEPIAQSNEEARRRLGHLADAFLMHDRDIYARYDDSVVFTVPDWAPDPPGSRQASDPPPEQQSAPNLLPPTSRRQFIRRSRGYAPFPVRLPFDAGQILATGAELKNTFCLTQDDFAFLSQHIGDMENLETLEHFEASVELLQHLFRIDPQRIAHDLHPDYAATRYALALGKPLSGVQHHQAHIASCLVDNGWTLKDGPVIGVAWDGTGLGLDGHIWGGEFFVGDYRGFRRDAHLEYLPMPGGDAAIRNPWRLALAYVCALTGRAPELDGVSRAEIDIVFQQMGTGLNTPLTSAAGRLFDAVAALLGLRRQVTFEAQAAIELEMLATRWAWAQEGLDNVVPYPHEVDRSSGTSVIRLAPLFEAIMADQEAGRDVCEIGWRFHLSLAAIIVDVGLDLAEKAGVRAVALSGGCFQNRLLLALVIPRLQRRGLRVLLHHQVPCNDGGISLGQIALAHHSET